MKQTLYIGIDTGVNTGFAIYCPKDKQLKEVFTTQLHRAILRLYHLKDNFNLKVRIEDARMRKWVSGGREKLQGVGSVKRDAKVLEEFCKDMGIQFELVAPKNNKTKLTSAEFARLTKWSGSTSSHARDAAMLIFGF